MCRDAHVTCKGRNPDNASDIASKDLLHCKRRSSSPNKRHLTLPPCWLDYGTVDANPSDMIARIARLAMTDLRQRQMGQVSTLDRTAKPWFYPIHALSPRALRHKQWTWFAWISSQWNITLGKTNSRCSAQQNCLGYG